MAVKNLISLEEFKVYKDIKLDNEENDSKLNALITRASAQIKTYCGKTFVDYVTSNKTEYFDGIDEESIFLDEYPVISIVSITPSLDGGATYTDSLVEYTDYFVNYDTGEISANTTFIAAGAGSVSAGKSNRNLKVIYKGGYKNLPEEIKQAAADLVEYYRAEEFTPRVNFQNYQVENLGFRQGGAGTLPEHIRRILDLYREL